MTDEILNIILPAATGTAGVLITKSYDAYKKSKSKIDRASALQKMYSVLEEVYEKDLELQRKLNILAIENDNYKILIKKLQNDSNKKSNGR